MPLLQAARNTLFWQVVGFQHFTKSTKTRVFSAKRLLVRKTARHFSPICDFFLTFRPPLDGVGGEGKGYGEGLREFRKFLVYNEFI